MSSGVYPNSITSMLLKTCLKSAQNPVLSKNNKQLTGYVTHWFITRFVEDLILSRLSKNGSDGVWTYGAVQPQQQQSYPL